jgi:hypothetical protein
MSALLFHLQPLPLYERLLFLNSLPLAIKPDPVQREAVRGLQPFLTDPLLFVSLKIELSLHTFLSHELLTLKPLEALN